MCVFRVLALRSRDLLRTFAKSDLKTRCFCICPLSRAGQIEKNREDNSKELRERERKNKKKEREKERGRKRERARVRERERKKRKEQAPSTSVLQDCPSTFWFGVPLSLGLHGSSGTESSGLGREMANRREVPTLTSAVATCTGTSSCWPQSVSQ